VLATIVAVSRFTPAHPAEHLERLVFSLRPIRLPAGSGTND